MLNYKSQKTIPIAIGTNYKQIINYNFEISNKYLLLKHGTHNLQQY
jgi:hypothetical protein